MDMLTLRNTVVRSLHDYLQRPVVLSDQAVPEADMPYAYYQPVQPYMPIGGAELRYSGGTLTRSEHIEATISFVACSADHTVDGAAVYGDNDALALADRMLGWFSHVGRSFLRGHGIAVVECGNVQNRMAIEIDEVARRYGFDVRLRYVHSDAVPMPSVVDGTINMT